MHFGYLEDSSNIWLKEIIDSVPGMLSDNLEINAIFWEIQGFYIS